MSRPDREASRLRAARRQARASLLAGLDQLMGAEVIGVGVSSDMVPILSLKLGSRRWMLEIVGDEKGTKPGVVLGLAGR